MVQRRNHRSFSYIGAANDGYKKCKTTVQSTGRRHFLFKKFENRQGLEREVTKRKCDQPIYDISL